MEGLDKAVDQAADRRSLAARALSFLPMGLMAATVLVTYALIVWTLRRGFDLYDESFVYTMIASNRVAVDVPLGFQHLLHPLYLLTGESVLAFRIIRLLGYVLVSVALVSCARAVVRLIGITIPRSGWIFVLLLAQVGTFLAWSYPPRYLSYNELASWLAQLGVGLIVVSLAWGLSSPPNQGKSWVLWPIWAALGAITTLLLFAKVTSAIAFGAVLAIGLVIPNRNLRLWKRVVSVGAGAMASLLVLWILGCPTGAYFKNAFALLFDESARTAIGHPISRLLSVYADSLLSTGRALVPALLIFALAMLTFRRNVRSHADRVRSRAIDLVTWILGAVLLFALISLSKLSIWPQLGRPKIIIWPYLGELIVFIGAAGIIGLLILGRNGATMRGSTLSRSFSVAFAGAAVVAAPFISAVGTNNQITGQFVFTATLWAVVLGVALVLLTKRGAEVRSIARGLPALIGCVVVLMAALTVKADIGHPYGSAPLLSLDTPTSAPELRGILLTPDNAAWLDWVSAAGDSLRADDVPATAIASPGALYAFNHSGYANPWILLNSLRLACTNDPPSDLFVLQPGTIKELPPTLVTKSLTACGIHFPGDFRVVGKRVSANPALAMTIWRLKSGG